MARKPARRSFRENFIMLKTLKLALLVAALLTIPSFWSARNLPDRVLGEAQAEPAAST